MNMKYAITAATGNFGQIAIKKLIDLVGSDNVIAIVRNLEKGQKLLPKGVEIRQGDYDDVTTMEKALKGIDRVLFISSQPGGKVARGTQHQNVVTAIKNAGVDFVAYTSFPNAQASTSALANDHRLTEKLIEEQGIKHSFLRNNWYLQNEMGFLQSGANNQTATYWTDQQAGWALEREYAEAAAKVITLENPDAIYEFAGKIRSYADLGAALQKATGNNFEVKQVSRDAYQAQLQAGGLDADTAALFTSFQAPIEDGSLSHQSDSLAKVLGRELTSLPEAINEILN